MQSDIALPRSSAGYTIRQRWAIIASVSLLAVILVSVAFAAGVYIGDNRELAPGVSPGFGGGPPPGQAGPQRFGQPQIPGNGVGQLPQPGARNGVPQQQLPQGQANPLPGQQPAQGARPGFDVVGSLASSTAGTLTVITAEGTRQTATDAQTRFVRDDGTAAIPAALVPNTVLGIRWRAGTQVADMVTIITGRAPQAQQGPLN
jgi:hypothetical protein